MPQGNRRAISSRVKGLLGATTLEALELVLDPFKRELRPMTMNLMGAVPFR
jgi:hypothetical protein